MNMMHKVYVQIFDVSKKMATVTVNRTEDQTEVFCINFSQNLTEGKIV